MTNSVPHLTIIVPTRNEAANIRPLLQRLQLALAQVDFGVLFVDDSTDDTARTVAQVAEEFPFPVNVLARPLSARNGLSGAVVDGFKTAVSDWLCVMDADLQHPPEVLPILWARAQEAEADIVVGSRKINIFSPGGLTRQRAFVSQSLTLLARMWFPRLLKNVSDPLTGLFLVRRSAIDLGVLQPDGFKILLEILIRCPGLRVSEVHFDFAPRHEGDSKADFREGMRFFRHLLRLRATANQSFPRLIVVALASLLLDTAVFVALTHLTNWPYWLTAVISAELFILLRFAVTERWVLGGGHPVPGWPSLRRFFLTNQISLLFVRLPLLALFISVWQMPLWLAGFLAILIEGGVRYLVSEQWVFSLRGLTIWQPGSYRYDIHGLLGIESQVPLPELAYFETAVPLEHVDISLRVDRHGTPSPQPGAITYDERLSRFGFGVAIMPGEFTEVVVSPALPKAPYALYKSVLEPVLRWAFLRKDVALVYGGCVSVNGRATLIVPVEDKGKTETVFTAVTQSGHTFLADDFTIMVADGRVFSFPKPVTMTNELLQETAVGQQFSWKQRVRRRLKNLFYSPSGRRSGLRMSQRRWPAATFNILLQRFLTPPKQTVSSLLLAEQIGESARLTAVLQLAVGAERKEPLPERQAIQFVQARNRAAQGFPPYALLDGALAHWHDRDWREVERTIIEQALHGCTAVQISGDDGRWWDVWQGEETAVSSENVMKLEGRVAGHR